jgi:hypothetical protein
VTELVPLLALVLRKAALRQYIFPALVIGLLWVIWQQSSVILRQEIALMGVMTFHVLVRRSLWRRIGGTAVTRGVRSVRVAI